MNAQALDLLLAVTLLQLISFVMVGSQGTGRRLCGQVDQLIQQAARRSIAENQTIIIVNEHAPVVLNCRDLNSLVRLDAEKVGRKIKASTGPLINRGHFGITFTNNFILK
ncbi:hypothetical protein Btru_029206 [Bulinus truncatus]|nr:hypothetical protein Btru_029206 [Bulinus truncatus]